MPSLHDNLLQRFSITDLLSKALVLVTSSWLTYPLKGLLCGETEVACLCKEFKRGSTLTDIVLDFALFNKTEIGGERLMAVMNERMVLPVSSGDCERAFSQMNLHHTRGRNRLQIKTVRELMLANINDSAQVTMNAIKYVIS